MARRCSVTGKGVMAGNNVSHAMNKTRRRFLPNLQSTVLYSEALSRGVKVRLSTRAIRTIEHNGGLDAWVQATAATKLPRALREVKRQLEKSAAAA